MGNPAYRSLHSVLAARFYQYKAEKLTKGSMRGRDWQTGNDKIDMEEKADYPRLTIESW